MIVLKYQEYNKNEEILNVFLDNLDGMVKEETSISDAVIKNTLSKLSNDLKFNIGLVFTFGSGIKVMIPIVERLIKNGNIKVELTDENILLLTLASLAICYLEESKNKAGDERIKCTKCESGCDECDNGFVKSEVTKKDAQTILEELKLRGIGNGIVRKFVSIFKSIGSTFQTIFKNTPYAINGLIEMFGYTSLLLPIMNGISAVVGKYDLTPENIIGNLVSLGVGMSTFVLKNGIDSLIRKIKNKSIDFNIDTKPKVEIINEQ